MFHILLLGKLFIYINIKNTCIFQKFLWCRKLKLLAICNFLTIKFYENLHEYFFVRNQFLIINNEKNYRNIKY